MSIAPIRPFVSTELASIAAPAGAGGVDLGGFQGDIAAGDGDVAAAATGGAVGGVEAAGDLDGTVTLGAEGAILTDFR